MSSSAENIPSAQFFRASVGAVILNGKGEVLAFQRKDNPDSWQFPQGGIDKNEEPLEAVYREVKEETGITSEVLELIQEYPDWLSYELPHEYRSGKTGRGQTQRWFFFKCMVENPRIELTAGDEFRGWRWIQIVDLIEKTPSFRKGIYCRLQAKLKELIDSDQQN